MKKQARCGVVIKHACAKCGALSGDCDYRLWMTPDGKEVCTNQTTKRGDWQCVLGRSFSSDPQDDVWVKVEPVMEDA